MLYVLDDPRGVEHLVGRHHPERPERLAAVLSAAEHPAVRDAVVRRAPRAATRAELEAVHHPALLDRLEQLRGRSGEIDADTAVTPASVDVAVAAAGAGLTAVDLLDEAGEGAAFCAVRPPGHHATAGRSMGFCLLNNVAVTAAALVARGERVVVVDFDAHHGNGTQDIFYDEPSVLFVSWHQAPLYPGTGRLDEIGGPAARGRTVNLPVPPATTGDTYRETLDSVVMGIIEDFEPTWLLVSAGYDAHRADPLTDLALTAGDYGDLMLTLAPVVPPGRVIAFLEGGYDLDALAGSALATMAALVGERVHPEAPSSGGTLSDRPRALPDAVVGAHGLR